MYIKLAEDISQGNYISSVELNVFEGPGYSLIITPYVLLNIPWIVAKYQNAVFLIIAVIYFYRILRFYIHQRYSFIFAFLFGLYFPFYSSLIFISPDILILLLICGFLFHYIKVCKEDKKNIHDLIISSLYAGYLIISKVVFAYIFAFFFIVLIIIWLKKRDQNSKTIIFICTVAFLTSSPYLIYTYSLTGNFFFWSDSKLYWLTSPYENEFGDWHHLNHFNLYPELKKNHYDFWMSTEKLNIVERDKVLRKKALENISLYPKKFLTNWFSNFGRLFFSYPYSYTNQKFSTFFYLVPNFILITIFILIHYIQKKFKIQIPKELKLIFLFAFIIFFIRSFVSADIKDFFIIVPFIIIYISFVKSKIKLIPRAV